MAQHEDLLPRDKFDMERVHKLKRMEKDDLIPLLPGLLEWIQDMNWPIAHDVAEILIKYPTELVPLIHGVLEGTDDIWKYWCLECLVKRLPLIEKQRLKHALIRIEEDPTADERLEELDVLAGEILREVVDLRFKGKGNHKYE